MNKKNVLLTGITGFLGSHTAIQLLQKGYHVTGTLRSSKRAEAIKRVIAKYAGVENLSLAEADITDANVWKQLTRNMHYVQHIASPFPQKLPKHEDELIIPARNGVLNLLKASAANGVQRVVITSSSSAISYGKEGGAGVYDETVWTNEQHSKDITPYYKSKTIAEKTAWEFMRNDVSGMQLSVVCPGAMLGPVLEEDFGTSANIVIKMLNGSMPAYPDIGFEIVDVRSVADLLIRAMELPQAANERYIGTAGYAKFKDVGAVLKAAYPARKIPQRKLPGWAVRLFSNFEPSLKPILIDLGKERRLNNTKARLQLNWQPLGVKEAILACAESVIGLGIVK